MFRFIKFLLSVVVKTPCCREKHDSSEKPVRRREMRRTVKPSKLERPTLSVPRAFLHFRPFGSFLQGF